jgi:hypothetical protein
MLLSQNEPIIDNAGPNQTVDSSSSVSKTEHNRENGAHTVSKHEQSTISGRQQEERIRRRVMR